MMNKFVVLLLSVLLGGCATGPCVQWQGSSRWCAAPLPDQPPFSARNEVITADVRGEQLQALASTEWTQAGFTQVVLTPFGQRLYRLHYDGQVVRLEAGLLPVPVSAEQALLDIQLMLWPAELLRAQLPKAWQLHEDATTGERQLRSGTELLAEVRRLGDGERELIQHRLGYRVRVQTLEQSP